MGQTPPNPTVFRVSELRTSRATRFSLMPEADARRAIAAQMGALEVRKLRFEGQLQPKGKSGWIIEAKLGATVVQPCVVTLAPVSTRIDQDVIRTLLPAEVLDNFEAGSESEMPEDDTTDVLGDEIDVAAMMVEALSLTLPTYPKAADAELESAQFAEEGVAPLTDEDTKPFAALAALKSKLETPEEDG